MPLSTQPPQVADGREIAGVSTCSSTEQVAVQKFLVSARTDYSCGVRGHASDGPVDDVEMKVPLNQNP